MSVPSTSQLASLRTRPHETRLRLAIYRPKILVAGQVNNPSILKGAVAIAYDNATVTGHLSVADSMTCYVGTTPGGHEVGRIRVRGATGSSVTVGRNSIPWSDNLYLTIVDFVEPQAIYHRIILDATGQEVVFYKDYDTLYNQDNTKPPPVVCMGFHQAALQGESIVWHSSGSFNPSGVALSSYLWTFYQPDGTTTTSTVAHPGALVYNQIGSCKTTCRIVDANGRLSTGTRYVNVIDPRDDPYPHWGLESLEGSRDQGGWRARLWVRNAFADVVEGALVTVIAEDWFDGVKLAIPHNIVFTGYIQDETISFNWQQEKVFFTALSVTGISGQRETYGTALDSVDVGGDAVGDGRDWTRMPDISTDKALIHYLRWNTTLLQIADFHQTGDTKLKMFADIVHGPIYGSVQTYLNSNLLASIVSDRRGTLWCEVDANYVPSGSRSYPTILTMDKRDWRGQPEIERTLVPSVSYAELGGVQYSGGLSGTFSAYLSGAPGVVPSYQGSPQRITGLALAGQTQLNQLAGDFFADAASMYKRVTFPMSGNYRIADIAPQERVVITLEAPDNYLGLVWNNKSFYPQSILHQYLHKTQQLTMDVTFKEETWGHPGDTIIIPIEPPDGVGDPSPDPGGGPPEGEPSGDLVYVSTREFLGRTRNWTSASPNWADISSGLGAVIHDGPILDPFDPKNRAYMVCGDGIYETQDLDSGVPTWTRVVTQAAILAAAGTASIHLCNMSATITRNGEFYLGCIYSPADTSGIGFVLHTANHFVTWTLGTAFTAPTGDTESPMIGVQASQRFPNIAYALGVYNNRVNQLFKTTNGGVSWSACLDTTPDGLGDRSFLRIAAFDVAYAASNASEYDKRVYVVHLGTGAGGNNLKIERSIEGGLNSTFVYDASDTDGISAAHYYNPGWHHRLIQVATGTPLDVMLMRPGENMVEFHRSTDNGVTWNQVGQFTDPSYHEATSFGRWPWNPNKCFFATANGPYYSIDGCVSILNKAGDWATVFGTAFVAPVYLVPMWVN